MIKKVAEDIMVPLKGYPHVPDSLTLADTLLVLKMERWETKNLAGRASAPGTLLVFNDDLRFVGLVRRRDIIRGLLSEFPVAQQPRHWGVTLDVKVDANILELSYDRIVEQLRERAKKCVKDVMLPIKTTINHNDHLMKAMQLMVECDQCHIPVTKKGKVVGVLRSMDVMHEIEQILNLDREK